MFDRNEPVSSASPNHAPKKRRRKDLAKSQSEMDGENMLNKHVKMGNVRMKAAARNVAVVGDKSLNPSKISTPLHEHSRVGKSLQDKLNAPAGPSKKKPIDATIKSSAKLHSKEASFLPKEAKDIEKHRSGAVHSKDLANKKVISALSDVIFQAYHDKVASSFQVDHQSRKSPIDTIERETSTKVRHKDKNGSSELIDLNSSGGKYALHIEVNTHLLERKEKNLGDSIMLLPFALFYYLALIWTWETLP